MKNLLVLFSVTLALVSGCATNSFRDAYVQNPDLRDTHSDIVSSSVQAPSLLTSTDPKRDAVSMIERGYVMLGTAQVNGRKTSNEDALDLAREIGAEIVVLKSTYVGTHTEYETVQSYHPISRVSTGWDTVDYGEPAYGNNFKFECNSAGCRTTETYSHSTWAAYSTSVTPVSVDEYSYHASFWARTNYPPALGVEVRNLNREEKARLGRTTGALVWAVIRNSPAEKAGLARGDLIVAIDDYEIIDSGISMGKLIRARIGQKTQINLLRGADLITKSAVLNERSW